MCQRASLSPLLLPANDFNERERGSGRKQRVAILAMESAALRPFKPSDIPALLLFLHRWLLKATSPADARSSALNHRGINLVKREA